MDKIGNIGCLGVAVFIAVGMFGDFPTFSVVIILLTIGLITFDTVSKKKREQKEREQTYNRKRGVSNLEEREEFSSSQKFEGNPFVSQVITIDENKKKIALIDGTNYKVYDYRSILSSEVLIDGNEVATTSRTSQIGGALLGGVLAGGVGAIIGGLSGDQKIESNISKIDLMIVVNDTKEPTFTLNFFNKDDTEAQRPHPKKYVKNELDKAHQLHNLISVLIRQADEVDKKEELLKNESANRESRQTTSSNADEIRKLAELMKEGIITKEEFEKEKSKMLSQSI